MIFPSSKESFQKESKKSKIGPSGPNVRPRDELTGDMFWLH